MDTEKKKKKSFLHIRHWKRVAIYLVAYDLVAVNLAYFLALFLRFDGQFSHIPERYMVPFLKFAPFYSVFCLIVFFWLQLYNSIWQYASFRELTKITEACIITCVFHIVGITLFFKRMPISYYCFGAIIQFMLMVLVRFSYRFVLLLRGSHAKNDADLPRSRVMLIGAGSAGQMILRDLNRAKETRDKVCCIIDDDTNKWNRMMEGVPVVGGRDDILLNVEKYHIDKIYVAIPSATAVEKRDILNICKESGCELKNLPGMYQFVTGEVSVAAMKDVAVEDLLGRDPIKVNLDEIFSMLRGNVILVTGGGGSIGSELCRQIAGHSPKQLIIFDVYENNAYEIEQELRHTFPDLNLKVLIGSVRDSRRVEQVFRKYRPDMVFHAAAHKHVPLMEESPCEAIKNNAFGTYKTAYAAMKYGAKRFVLISTDKAVNPTNVMGASKRLCEMVIQFFDRMVKEGRSSEIPALYEHAEGALFPEGNKAGAMLPDGSMASPHTEFVAVRFGNVLGSNGSVIPLFKKQIAAGGPVTVTHPDIIRYFMTIPEAVSLVLQAGAYAEGGEIFVLDMGSPVKIDTLARNLIKLSGYKPDEDIKIEYTGLRPGEKLYEEKLMDEEGLKTTPNKLIHIGSPIPVEPEEFLADFRELMRVAYDNNDGEIRNYLARMVKTFRRGSDPPKQEMNDL